MTLAFLLSNAIFVTVVFYLQKMNEDAGRNFSIQLPCGEGENVEPIGIAFTFVFGIMLVLFYNNYSYFKKASSLLAYH